jgi:hypothetical protein
VLTRTKFILSLALLISSAWGLRPRQSRGRKQNSGLHELIAIHPWSLKPHSAGPVSLKSQGVVDIEEEVAAGPQCPCHGPRDPSQVRSMWNMVERIVFARDHIYRFPATGSSACRPGARAQAGERDRPSRRQAGTSAEPRMSPPHACEGKACLPKPGVKRIAPRYYRTIAAWVYLGHNYRVRCNGKLLAYAYAIVHVKHRGTRVTWSAIPVLAEVTAELNV